jgi:hypothetical protein
MTDPKPIVSTTLSSADEHDAESAALIALKCVEGSDDDDEKINTAPKVKRAPFVAKANEDLESGSCFSKEVASKYPSTARKTTCVDSFLHEFDRDELPPADAMVAASASTSASDTRRHKLSKDEQRSGAPPGVLSMSSHPVLSQGGQLSNPEALPIDGLGIITEEISQLNTTIPPSQRSPVPAQNGDTAGFLAESFLVTENPLMITAVADVVPDPPPTKFWRGSRFQCLILFLILVVGVFVGVAVGGSGGSGGGGEPTMAKEAAPLISAFPTAAPTETPNNAFCDEAFDVTGDDTVIVGSLENIAVETRLTCSSGDEIEQRGRWFKYSGNGLGLTVTIQSAVEDETTLELFMGTCQQLECTETIASSLSTVNFIATVNTTYLIYVFSTLDAMSEPSTDYNLEVSNNGGCLNAYPVNIDTQALYSGSTTAATVSDLARPLCSATAGVSPGVWFEVVGDGLNIEASTCGGASFDTQISVYTGGCGSLECVNGNNDLCGSQSSILWLSRVSKTDSGLLSSPMVHHTSLPALSP